jgi:hypothetical protein
MSKLINGPEPPQSDREELPINLRQFMLLCRKRTPMIMECLDDIIQNPATETGHKLGASTLYLAYGYGKPQQKLSASVEHHTSRVHLYLPDNGRGLPFSPGRDNLEPETIDPEGNQQSDLDC